MIYRPFLLSALLHASLLRILATDSPTSHPSLQPTTLVTGAPSTKPSVQPSIGDNEDNDTDSTVTYIDTNTTIDTNTNTTTNKPSASASPSIPPTTTLLPSSIPTTPSPTEIPTPSPTISTHPSVTHSDPPTLHPSTSVRPSATHAPSDTQSPSTSAVPSSLPSAAPTNEPIWECSMTKGLRIKKGRPTEICVVVSTGGNWSMGMTYRRWIFKPMADEFSRFVARDSYMDLINHDLKVAVPPTKKKNNNKNGGKHKAHRTRTHIPGVTHQSRLLQEDEDETEPEFDPCADNEDVIDQTKHVHIHVASQTQSSFLRRFYDEDREYVFSHLTAIIEVDRGVVLGVTWDQACMFCNPIRCRENTFDFFGMQRTSEDAGGLPTKSCFIRKTQCDELMQNATETECALNIFFAWTGTDVNGQSLTSVNSRHSNFNKVPQIGPPDAEDLKEIVDNAIDGVKNDINNTMQCIKKGVDDSVQGIKDNIKNKVNETMTDMKDKVTGGKDEDKADEEDERQ